MEIIAEKINGTRKEVGAAVVGRDTAFIQQLARLQAAAGATYIDVNAGTGKTEPEDLVWLTETVQAAVDLPLCLDSANPAALGAALPRAAKLPLINSISGERSRLEGVLPLVAEYGTPVIALAADDNGISKELDRRIEVVRAVIAAIRDAGVADGLVYVDPLVMPLAGFHQSGALALAAMRAVKAEFPEVKLAVGLSNLSYGLPARGLINRVFLAFAVEAGLDAVLVDPNDRAVMQELVAAELVLGRDPFCRQYTQSYRAGRFGFEGTASAAPAPQAQH
ncbi:MAG: dihydropteroate synthase [Actinobacteria bacterium]|nr:dihydropteroate synthase [Actinomycetota bacterium]